MTPIGHWGGGESLVAGAETLAVMNRASLCIEASEHPIIKAAEKILHHNNRRLHIVALTGVHPGDGRISRGHLGWSNITLGIQPNRSHRAKSSVSTGKVRQPISDDGCWNRNVPAAVQTPGLFAGVEIVSRCFMPAVHEDLCCGRGLDNRG